MKHGRSHHANVLDTETSALTETAPLDDNGFVVEDVVPDLLHKLVPCFQGNSRGPWTLGHMSELFWKVQGDCNGLFIVHLNGIHCSGHVFYPITILRRQYRNIHAAHTPCLFHCNQ